MKTDNPMEIGDFNSKKIKASWYAAEDEIIEYGDRLFMHPYTRCHVVNFFIGPDEALEMLRKALYQRIEQMRPMDYPELLLDETKDQWQFNNIYEESMQCVNNSIGIPKELMKS